MSENPYAPQARTFLAQLSGIQGGETPWLGCGGENPHIKQISLAVPAKLCSEGRIASLRLNSRQTLDAAVGASPYQPRWGIAFPKPLQSILAVPGVKYHSEF